MLEARNASLEYLDQGRPVFACHDINLQVAENEFLGILGPSGSGKSSLLYLLSGLKVPTQGDILYRGKSLPQMRDEDRCKLRIHDFGFVFQQPFLLGYLSALENVVIAAPHNPDVDQAMALLDELGLGAKSHRLPHELSGGEKQRVCVARALLAEPSVIFADEPTAALDHRNGAATVKLINRLRGRGALVMVTHDPSMLEEADRVVRLVDGEILEDQALSGPNLACLSSAMLLQEPAYLLLADVNLGGRSLAAGSVGSQEGFGAMFQPLMEAGVLHQFDPEDIWPDSESSNSVEIHPSPVTEAKSLLRLLEEGNALNREQLARHARRLLFSLESLTTGEGASEGRPKSLRDAPSMN